MQQKNESNYTEVISMEEYLSKRKEKREQEKRKEKKKTVSGNHIWMLAELYV